MKTLAIIQARMGSERLPGKVLLPLGSSIILDYVVSRCQKINHIHEVIVATSKQQQDDAIENWCLQNHVPIFRGSEEDVLSRYYECALPYKPDYVIRVTGDCPFMDYDMANQMVELMQKCPSDMLSIQGESELTRGLVVEVVSFKALEYMHMNGKEVRHREHVTYYAKEFPSEFQLTPFYPSAYASNSDLRMTLDTPEDYELCQAIVRHLGEDKKLPAVEMVTFLKEHPELASINSYIQQKPVQ
ncbi:NTP transferase domain-containing protein [Paenibacillus sp. LMG 31461]|uniref:NTP transferase domain-containing protein n=1 Tax=Paenibacillus plantarum TaxID=2654975 RepID=A0ABX1XEA9_9BACL|nr:glycosyltransferase family protein [Paenibacillus plantarum]NOU66731.1 NTP transferase domain-containing protein [Paenibacillus plantarum]